MTEYKINNCFAYEKYLFWHNIFCIIFFSFISITASKPSARSNSPEAKQLEAATKFAMESVLLNSVLMCTEKWELGSLI
jgi:hypothetical protein